MYNAHLKFEAISVYLGYSTHYTHSLFSKDRKCRKLKLFSIIVRNDRKYNIISTKIISLIQLFLCLYKQTIVLRKFTIIMQEEEKIVYKRGTNAPFTSRHLICGNKNMK